MTVTPALAEKWLSWNIANRPLTQNWVENLAQRMRDDEWTLNGQPIIFDTNGDLRNGQHRLSAVILAGMDIEFDVRFGVAPESFSTMDDVRKRSAGDVLSVEGVENYATVAAACRLILAIYDGQNTSNQSGKQRPSNEHIRRFYHANPEIDEAATKAQSYYKSSDKLLNTSEFAAFYFLMRKQDHTLVDSFMDGLAYGANLSTSSPVFQLRRILLKYKMDKTATMIKSHRYRLIAKAWHLYRTGAKIKRLFTVDSDNVKNYLL